MEGTSIVFFCKDDKSGSLRVCFLIVTKIQPLLSVLTVKLEQMTYLVAKLSVNSNNNFAFLDLRKATIPIFYDMMKVEFAERQSFQQVSLIISRYRP